MRSAWAFWLAAVLALPVHADNVLGNLHLATGAGTNIVSGSYKAVAFTTPPGRRWWVNSVSVSLTPGASAPEVSIWSGNGSAPTSRLLTLVTPTMGGTDDYRFFAPNTDELILEPGVKYWVYVTNLNASTLNWLGTSPSTDPVGIMTPGGYVLNGSPSATRNRVMVDLRPVQIDNMRNTAPGTGGTNADGEKVFMWVNRRSQPMQHTGFVVTMERFSDPASLDHRVYEGTITDRSFLVGTSGGYVAPLETVVNLSRGAHIGETQAPGDQWQVVHPREAADGDWRWTNSSPSGAPTGLDAQSRGYWFAGAPSSTPNRIAIFAHGAIASAMHIGDLSSGFSNTVVGNQRLAVSITLPHWRVATPEFLYLPLFEPGGNPAAPSLWRGDARPETLVATFEDSEVVTGPVGGSGTLYRFRNRAPSPLVAGETYWVVLAPSNASSPNPISWIGRFSNSPILARGLAHGSSWLRSTNAGATWTSATDTDSGFWLTGPGTNACPADISGSSDPADPAYGRPDGIVDSADFFFFLDQFEVASLEHADVSSSSDPASPDYAVRDRVVDASDFFVFLDQFELGCP